jgi:acid phosphatase type 7
MVTMNRYTVLYGAALAAVLLALAALLVLIPERRTESLETTTIVGGAGDIAGSYNRDSATAELVQGVLDGDPSALAYTLGDNAYPYGRTSDFLKKYDPTWGVFKSRTLPVLGNHDYYDGSGTAQPAKDYFAGAAHDLSPTYYAMQLNPDWVFIALDSSKTETKKATGAPACDSTSPQVTWLTNQLASARSNGQNVILAYHHPRFSNSSDHPTDSTGCPRRFFDLAVQYDADLVLSGHAHLYERFSKRDASGAMVSDGVNGVTQITVGTGGATLDNVRTQQSPHSDVLRNDVWGVLQIDLRPDSYTYKFLKTSASPAFSDTGTEPVNP